MKKKGIAAVLLSALMFAGCAKDGKLYSKSQVLRMVDEVTPTEKYKLLSVDHDTESVPKVDTYYFESKERDLAFTAVSTRSQVWFDGPTNLYSKEVHIGYVDAVHEYYREEITSVFDELESNDRGEIVCRTFADLEHAAEVIARADQIYAAERTYNTQEWMNENPYGTVSLAHMDGDGKQYSYYRVEMNGALTEEGVYKAMTYRYVQSVYDGQFEDLTIPAEQMKRAHKRDLETIWIDDVNMTELCMQNAKAADMYNRTESHMQAHYYYDWEGYNILLDCGLAEKKCAPKWMETYAEVLGFDLKEEERSGKMSWKYNGDSWEIRAEKDKNDYVNSFIVKKNGKDQEIPYLTVKDNYSSVGATYLVAVKAEDFAKMFDLTLTIDEENGRLEFHR